MSRKENAGKNMEFLIRELQKEWDASKQTRHTITLSVKEAEQVCIRAGQKIADMGEMLQKEEGLSFKDSIRLCKKNYVMLRAARKLIAGRNKAEASGKPEYGIAFDKEEYSCYRRLAKEKQGD